jgi:uncharacterized surface protein with fasciclin (FAS1) repeats
LDIVEVAINAGVVNTLVKAVQLANLVNDLKGKGPFTVFAPTDNAFNAVPKETLNSLLNDIPKLKAVLLYHVVQGKYYSNNVKELLANQKEVKVTTLQGGEITITLKGMLSKSIYVNDAKVIKPDVEADNGVIHIIDKVIIPKI